MMPSWQGYVPSSSGRPESYGVGDRIGAGRRNFPLSITLQYRGRVSNPLNMNNFHEVLTGTVHESSLASLIGRVRLFLLTPFAQKN
jgi:hypothetical protein